MAVAVLPVMNKTVIATVDQGPVQTPETEGAPGIIDNIKKGPIIRAIQGLHVIPMMIAMTKATVKSEANQSTEIFYFSESKADYPEREQE